MNEVKTKSTRRRHRKAKAISKPDISTASSSQTSQSNNTKQSTHLMDLPFELIEKIGTHIPKDKTLSHYMTATALKSRRMDPKSVAFMKARYSNLPINERDRRLKHYLESSQDKYTEQAEEQAKKIEALTRAGARIRNWHNAGELAHPESLRDLSEKLTQQEINSKDSNGRTVLHHLAGALSTDLKIVKHVTDRMSQEAIDAKDSEGKTALHYAAEQGNVDILRYLTKIMSQRGINARDNDGDTALSNAIDYVYDNMDELSLGMQMIQQLVDVMSNDAILAKGLGGYTTFMNAVSSNLKPLIIYIFDRIGKIDARSAIKTINSNNYDFHQTALHIAASPPNRSPDLNLIKYLTDRMNNETINKRDDKGETALHKAVQKGASLEVLEHLLKVMSKDAIYEKNKKGQTALDIAYSIKDDKLQSRMYYQKHYNLEQENHKYIYQQNEKIIYRYDNIIDYLKTFIR